MPRMLARHRKPDVEALEGRAVPSVSTVAGATSYLLPYIEQENLRAPATPRQPPTGNDNQIIAILIG